MATKTSRPSRARRAKAGSLPAGISRIDSDASRTHGYFVRVGYVRRRPKSSRPKHSAFFGDASHGGKKGALRAAAAWTAKMRTAERRSTSAKRGTKRG